MFMSTPSMGFDNVLYEVSKFKKVKYICLFQVHNNRFFWTQSWDDMGIFSSSKPIFPIFKIETQKKIFDPYYMVRFQKNNLNKESYIKRIYLKLKISLFLLYMLLDLRV